LREVFLVPLFLVVDLREGVLDTRLLLGTEAKALKVFGVGDVVTVVRMTSACGAGSFR
jgi:hypothetical protein